MKFILSVVVVFSLVTVSAFAQSVNVRGSVQDADTGNPLEFANIAVLSKQDSSVVGGGMAELDGSFDFGISSGDYILRVGFIGYKSYFRDMDLSRRSSINVGAIRLSSDTENLEEVLVEGVTSMFESDIDKRRYNVENSIVAEGATATELLETLPSIQVDEEGGISMRGSGSILVYINGRPSNLSGDDAESILAQFPANSIQSVELITNPSSRYDAGGVGGIINIILKKNERVGLNGQVNVAAGTREKYNVGFNLNYGARKVNYYASYNFQDRRMFRESEAYRVNNLANVSPVLDQDSYGESFGTTHFLRGGLDYNPNESTTLGFYVQGNFRDQDSNNLLNQRSQDISGNLDSLYIRDENNVRESSNFETGVNYAIEFDTLGQKLLTSLSYSRDERTQFERFDQTFFNQANEEVLENRITQINERPQTSDLYVFQLDYLKPVGNDGMFESGLKGTFGTWNRQQEFLQGDISSGFVPIRNDTISDTFDFKEDVYAAYLSYRNRLGKIGYQAGLRGEYTETISFQGNNSNTVVNNYFNLFPSVYFTYDLGEEEEFTANFSRRIQRPNMWGLSPFYWVRDLLNLGIGNPQLQPEFTDSYEFGYKKGWERLLFNATVYHRYSTDILTRVIRLTDDNVAIQTRENANSRINTGLELINQIQLANWVDMTLSGNFFYSEIRGDNIEQGFNNSNYSWTISLLSNMVVPDFLTIQVQGNYRGPIVLPQGQIEPFWGLNVGVKKDVLNNKGTISLNVSDIFNSRVFRISTEDARFYQDRMFNRETRIGTLSFTYRFGGFKEKSNGRGERDDDFGDDGDM